MNFNENLKMRENPLVTSIQGDNQKLIEHIGHFIIGVNVFNGTNIVQKINALKLNEMPWFPCQLKRMGCTYEILISQQQLIT